jgi:hypothetical protein
MNELHPSNVINYCTSPSEGHSATLTVVNDATSNRITVRFHRPKGFQTLLVDLLVGSDNEKSYGFVGSVRDGIVYPSKKSKVSDEKIAVT